MGPGCTRWREAQIAVKVLVTGSTSMIGRATVAALEARGDVVTTLQRGSSDVGTVALQGSITDSNAAAAAVNDQDAVVHLAARVGVTGPWEDYESVNVEGTRTLIEAARAAGVGRFVHVSSPSVAHSGSSIVGGAADPATPDEATSHYSRSKAMAEVLALAASDDQMPVVAIRPHLVIGPGDTQLIERIVDRARQGRLPLIGSGLALIDTTWIDNAADALVAAVDRCPDLGGRSLVVSNGEPRTVHELFARITAAAGVEWSPRHVPARVAIAGGGAVERVWDRTGRTEDPPMTAFGAEQLSTAHWFDQRETQQALGWQPRVTLAEGFDQLTRWFRNQS